MAKQTHQTKGTENKKAPSRSETGHAKNIGNFEALIEEVKTMPKYKPNTDRFTIAGLDSKLKASILGNENLHKADIALGKLITQRQEIFEPIETLSTRVINALADTEASDGFKKQAVTIARKLQGRRAKPIKKEEAPEADGETAKIPTTKSVSQRSFDNKLENFKVFVELISTEPTYKNDDEELNVASLQAKVQNMQTINKAAKEADANFGEQLRIRNEILYQEKYGLKDIALEVKKLVRGAYGSRSPKRDQYRPYYSKLTKNRKNNERKGSPVFKPDFLLPFQQYKSYQLK